MAVIRSIANFVSTGSECLDLKARTPLSTILSSERIRAFGVAMQMCTTNTTKGLVRESFVFPLAVPESNFQVHAD